MKKIALLLVMVVAVTVAFGQKNVRQSASNYLKEGKLDKAMEAINQCVLDPSTAQDAKAWFLRGNIYLEINNTKEEKYKSLDTDALTKSMESYQKAIEFDPKKEYYDDIVAKLSWQRDNYYNLGVENYNNKSFGNASEYFAKGAAVLELAKIADTSSLLNAAICASLAQDNKSAKKYYLKLIENNYKSANLYMSLADIYRIEKDSASALKYVRLGQQQFPGDYRLFLTETNIYLTFNNTDKALSNLTVAMEKDSANYSVAFAMGTIYDMLSNDSTKSEGFRKQAFESAIGAYKKSIRLNPEYFDGNYNLGALYVNKAASINDEANKLPLDATDKYDVLKKDADRYLEMALPYLEKSSELQPEDLNTLFSLKQIYVRTNKGEKVKAIQARIDAIQKK